MTTPKEADHVYVLMTDKYRISRNTRAQWYCNHLNKNVTIEPFETLVSFPIIALVVIPLIPLFFSLGQI